MKKWIISILILGFASHSMALERFNDVAIHGFISQGYLITTENDFFLSETTDGTFQFNEIGLNFGTNMTDSLRLSVQFLAKDVGVIGNDEVGIDYAMADYNYRDWLGLRVGKLKKPLGIYNQSRDVDAGRPSIFLPQSIYFEIYRDQSLSIKGVGLYGRLLGQLDYQAFYGVFDIPPNSGFNVLMEHYYTISPESYDIDPSVNLFILWNPPILEGLSLGGTLTTFDFTSNITDTIGMTMSGVQPILSIEYMYGDFIFSAEYEWHTAKTSFTGVPQPATEADYKSYYAMASYRFTQWLQIAGGYSILSTKSNDETIPEDDLKDLFLSIRFDINEYWVFKLEGHAMDGIFMVTNDNDPEENWQMFAAKLTYSF